MDNFGIHYVLYFACAVYVAMTLVELGNAYLINQRIKKTEPLKQPSKFLSFEDSMDILDTVVAHVISDMELVYSVKEVKYIKNVDVDIKEATNKVMVLLSDNVHDNLCMYVTREYVITYVSRNIRSFILAYLDSRK